jgi:hypothetical protein
MELKLTHLANDNNRYRRERERLEEILQSTQVRLHRRMAWTSSPCHSRQLSGDVCAVL